MDALQQIGRQHPRVKQIRRLIKGSGGSQRLLVAEGLWAHELLLDLNAAIEVFLWCPEAASCPGSHARSAEIAARAASAYRVSPRILDQLCEREQPEGMISLVPLPTWDAEQIELQADALVLVADAIEIPGNLGTLLRTLDACGGDCLIITNRRTRLSHPKVFRGSRGMNLRVPVIEFAQPADAARWLRDRDVAVYLATVGADAKPYREARYPRRAAVVVGNERYGVSQSWIDLAPDRVTIPMRGLADSLNVSVSASILLYEIRAQRDEQAEHDRSPPRPAAPAPAAPSPSGSSAAPSRCSAGLPGLTPPGTSEDPRSPPSTTARCRSRRIWCRAWTGRSSLWRYR
jgi:tRNA G18 (ribose-2'-O)-methylase SpoU